MSALKSIASDIVGHFERQDLADLIADIPDEIEASDLLVAYVRDKVVAVKDKISEITAQLESQKEAKMNEIR